MPSHIDDLQLIPKIQQNITHQISQHPQHTYILCGDFNRDIAFIAKQNEHNTTPPQIEDIEWRTFTDYLLTYLLTAPFSRQGGQNYTHTSLIDGYYINTPNISLYTTTTNHNHNLNSNHSPVILHIPPNSLLAQPTLLVQNKPPRILNPIPQENIEKFKIQFFEEHILQINELTTTLTNKHLTDQQWQIACNALDYLIQSITNKMLINCSTPPLPQLTNRTSQQGSFLPEKLQKNGKLTSLLTI